MKQTDSDTERASDVRSRAILIAIAILCAAVRLKYAYMRASTPFQMDYEEGNILNAALRVLGGETPYPIPGSFPYVLNPYGPVGYVLSALAVRLFGVSLFGPRLLVLAAGAGTSLLIIILANRHGVNWGVASLFGALFLCSPLLWKWFPLLRVDLWAIFLSLLGLCIFLIKPQAWSIAAVVFALALLTKHTALAAPLACFVELISERKPYQALAFIGLTGSVTVWGISFFSGDPVFNLFETHPDPYLLTRALGLYCVAIERSLLVLAIIVYGVAFGFRWSPRSRLAWLYCGLCSLTAFTAGKMGSETNHFLEWTAAVCLLGSLSLNHLLEVRNPLTKPLLLGVAALTVIFTFLPQRLLAKSAERTGCQDAYAFVHSFPGDRILSEDVSALVLGGKPVLVSNPFLTTQLGNAVFWSRGSIETLIENRYFQLVVLEGVPGSPSAPGRWSPSFMTEIGGHYKFARSFECPSLGSVFVPNKAP